jgi:hypothetical protein
MGRSRDLSEGSYVATDFALASSNLPAGSVLQTVYHAFNDATSVATSYTYAAVTNGSTSITSIGSNSKFLVTISASLYQYGGNGTHIGCNRTIGGTATRIIGVDGSLGDSWLGHGNGPGATTNQTGSITRFCLDEPSQSAGTEITYGMLLTRWTSGTVYINYASYDCKSYVMIQEIAG